MARRGLRRIAPGIVAGLALLLASLAIPQGSRELLRQRVFDQLLAFSLALRPLEAGPRLVIVDIDQASIEAVGPWPWRREQIARLVAAVTATRPAAVALDILLAGEDVRSPAALARQLTVETGRADLARLATELPDGDQLLARAISSGPVVLGWVLDPRGASVPGGAPILLREGAGFGRLWQEDGASGPPQALAAASSGSGGLSLPGDADAVVRRVPLFLMAGSTPLPGLAVEALRLADGASGYLLSADPPRVQIGSRVVPLPDNGMLRLIPNLLSIPVLRAIDVLEGRGGQPAIGGAVVVIGGSAPELGGLRASAGDPLVSSAAIQAGAIRQIAAGRVPLRVTGAGVTEAVLAFAGILVAAAATLRLGPFRAGWIVLLFAAGSITAALGLTAADRLLDPLPAVACAVVAFLATAAAVNGETRLREARLRRRFEQHLAPGVVERIVADPGSLKLSGELREITALFTDIEGFTEVTRAAGAESLVRVLDSYFDGVARLITAHGGTIDKFVGDAVHAFFNAPLDLDRHAGRAVACAGAIAAWTEAHRRIGEAAAIGLGRTRIGVETGMAIVGDVGIGSKLDYTAHGDVMNTAARLEALNKDLGTAICIGPTTAGQCGTMLAPLGTVTLKGLDTIAVFTLPGVGQHAPTYDNFLLK